MADYHFVYKDVEGRSTEWDDIQRRLGNLPPKPEPFKPPPFAPKVDADEQPKLKEWLDEREPEELEELEDDLDDDRFLEQYRKMRLAELREAAKASRFGSIVPITGSDFVREVSQAPSDVWVVVFLYKDGIPECGLLQNCLEELATRYPATKFVKIISTDCIPNYPDRNVPTILVYNNSAVKGTYVGLQKFGGKRCTPEYYTKFMEAFLYLNIVPEILFPAIYLGFIYLRQVTVMFLSAVALALCQSDPVLNDGHGGSDSSRDNVIEGVRRKFIEKVVAQHEEREEEDSD
ncbi:unnamed protein product [Miscanthus lutarioriparius]|uniref:Phosducin domain-containing protein n=1 Tax=Miscanthus lutarioriparius TaxID=422564 RepID=A0A811SMZ5_9POAL|nr:unnamed protein product [Miscanthus lutarioriparius]